MPGTKAGGAKAKARNIEKYGEDYYAVIGRTGGKNGTKENGSVKGFAANPELAKTAGAKGGHKSKRTKVTA